MITDVPGLRVGHAADPIGLTGLTVVLCDRPATGGVALRGGANDVVGLDYLHPRHLVTTVNGAVLGGGSRFGEEAIYGVMRWLRSEEHTSELQSPCNLVCRLLLEKKKHL